MSRRLDSTPRADGFRMPGEFEPHTGCWMIWPERTDNWRNGAKPAQAIFAQLAATIARFEPVTMGVSTRQYRHARASLPSHVRVVELSSNDAWVRDSGPTFVINDAGEVRGIDWIFNAWGGLQKGMYFPWDQDELVAMKILEMERADRYQAPVVLEGGSIHVDGEGTLLTTEECLLNPNRNPHLSRSEIEQTMRDYLGIEHIIWLGDGVYLDETDGHIDNLACFIRPGVVALTWTDDQSDPQYDISHAAYERLMTARDAARGTRGRPLEVHRIHQPDILYITEEENQGVDALAGSMPRSAGTRLPASYINFYIATGRANGGVIVPQFDDPVHDRAALEKLQALFPEREVVGFPGREILLGGGNIHCITQQQPTPQ